VTPVGKNEGRWVLDGAPHAREPARASERWLGNLPMFQSCTFLIGFNEFGVDFRAHSSDSSRRGAVWLLTFRHHTSFPSRRFDGRKGCLPMCIRLSDSAPSARRILLDLKGHIGVPYPTENEEQLPSWIYISGLSMTNEDAPGRSQARVSRGTDASLRDQVTALMQDSVLWPIGLE
jgi:hypothetical protein